LPTGILAKTERPGYGVTIAGIVDEYHGHLSHFPRAARPPPQAPAGEPAAREATRPSCRVAIWIKA